MADLRAIEDSMQSSQSQKTLEETLDVAALLDSAWPVLVAIISGERTTWRSRQFFKSQRERAVLHHEVCAGPLSFAEYYLLSDQLHARVEAAVSAEEGEGKLFHAFAAMAGIVGTSMKLLLTQFTSMVLLPELVLHHVKQMYPDRDDVEAQTRKLWQENRKDYVQYLLSRRDLARWGRRAIK